MKFTEIKTKKLWFLPVLVFAFVSFADFSFAQSRNQEKPTPVITQEINGEISPRSVGDSRLTNYFYTFKGNQGDVFINVVTNNLDGDIDIFTSDGLEPLTKIPVFAGVQDNETGRVIYLRKSETLILRIQGRTPNDDPAKYQIKFAGSFVPLQTLSENEDSDFPKVNQENKGVAKVNSVGTIIEVYPKPTPDSLENTSLNIPIDNAVKTDSDNREIIIGGKKEVSDQTSAQIEIRKEKIPTEEKNAPIAEEDEGNEKAKSAFELIFSDILEKEDKVEGKSDADRTANPEAGNAGLKLEKTEEKLEEIVGLEEEKTNSIDSSETKTGTVQPLEPSQLANISLVVKFKDGTKFNRSMDKIVWFNVDKGILTIITQDGTILKFSMLDVEIMTFENEK